MAAYMGRDVSKLKNKGGKWKYVPRSYTLFTLVGVVDASCTESIKGT